MRLSHTVLVGLTGLGLLAPSASVRADSLDAAATLAPSLTINISDILTRAADLPAQPAPASAPGAHEQPHATAERALGYGLAGSRWWTIGTAYANNFKDASDINVHFAFSQFLDDELEFAVEGAGWYFHQNGDDTGGISASMVFRWHIWHPKDFKWTVFGDAGIGILGSFDNVPDGGTGFNFLPRLGGGFTYALNDSIDGESRGPRLMVGVRYHHISNGRISGDSRNPARDGIAIYAGLVIPF